MLTGPELWKIETAMKVKLSHGGYVWVPAGYEVSVFRHVAGTAFGRSARISGPFSIEDSELYRCAKRLEKRGLVIDPHISEHDLERYHLGMVTDEAELAPLEEHILSCSHCARRAEEAADYVNAMRAAMSELPETDLANYQLFRKKHPR